jgi:hypothetical protein
MMLLRTKLEIAAGALFVAGSAFGFTSWLGEHDDRLRAQAEASAAKKDFDKAADLMKQHADADKARDDATAKQLEAMQKLAAQIQTPAQIAAWLPKQVPGLPQPITISVPPSTAQNPKPDAQASIPQADLPVLRDVVENCRENSVKLSTCQADQASKQEQLRLAGEQLSAVERERDAYKTALKGGTFWTRTKRAGKWIIVGAGLGAAAICGSGHCK